MGRIRILVLVSSIFVAFSAVAYEPTSIQSAPGVEPRTEIVSSRDDGVTFVFELPELVTEELSVAGERFQRVSIPGGGFHGNVGEPAVPIFSRFVAIPRGADVEVRVIPLEEEEIDSVRLLPVQAGDGSEFVHDRRAYERAASGLRPDVTVGEPAVLRDLRVVPLTFRPVRYDPAGQQLRVARRMRVEIDFIAGGARGAEVPLQPSIPPSFDQLYRDLVLNYSGPAASQSVTPGTYLVICPNNSTIISTLQELLAWRERSGVPTMLATTSETGTSRTAIKSYIQQVYADPEVSLEYVVLVGDASGSYSVATWYESLSGYNGEGDLPYSQLTGGGSNPDILPDIHIGRLSIDSPTTLGYIVDKIIGYEKTPYVSDPSWFERSCIVGDPGTSGQSCVIAGQWLAHRLDDFGYAESDTVFTSPWVSQMQTGLNRGSSIFTYRGWLGMSGWSNAYTSTLANGWKMPFAVIITCDTGSFASGTSRSEAFLRVWNSSGGVPRGAIGSIGMATIGTHTRYNNCLYYGIFRGLVQEGTRTMGASLTRGCLELYLNYGMVQPGTVEYWSHWANLMGDPAVPIWLSYPEALDVTHPSDLAIGANSVPVTVSEGGEPVEAAQVCLSKGGETYIVGFTDAQGVVELPVTTLTSGNMLFTVTKPDKQPYLATLPVAAEPLYIGHADATIDDDSSGESSGNGDGLINPGETVELAVQIENFGTQSTSGVWASLSSTDPYVQIIDDRESFEGSIPGGGTAWTIDDFDFIVDADCPHGHVISLGLDIENLTGSWHSLIELEVISAALVTRGTTVYDGNSRLDPGETAELTVKLRNDGQAAAIAVSGTLVSESNYVTVDDSEGTFGTIGIGGNVENGSDRFMVSADPSTYGGYSASLLLIVSYSAGLTDTIPVTLVVGVRDAGDPVGPDAYGYLAYDNTDTAFSDAPTYNWIEIDPAYGGDGVEVVLGDYGGYQDKSRVVDLPFPFDYYGETYTQATVCSNGWLAMGSHSLTAYRNWTIPGAGGPNGMLAVFWDNLYQSSGSSKAFQKYDAANGRWILEWSRFRNDYNGATETFQIILYDPAQHATDTGDGLIVYQYETVTNYDPTNGYATVGIESPDQLDGILYTYFNQYSTGAATLSAGRAIRFVPVQEGPSGTLTGSVLNASNGDTPIEGAEIALLEAGRSFISIADGTYHGQVAPGTYTVVVGHPGFEPDTTSGVGVQENEITTLDAHLTDVAGPMITTTIHPWTEDTTGPYPIPVTIVEHSGLPEKTLYYSAGEAGFTPLTLQPQGGDDYLAQIPGQPAGTVVRYYVYARDGIGLETFDPPGGASEAYWFIVATTEVLTEDTFEAPGGWTVGAGDDDASTGIWVRADPVGSSQSGHAVQPENDHTPSPGTICYITGNANPGESAGTNDVDGGKTTLFSPVFDLESYFGVSVSYWTWYSNEWGNSPGEDSWVVEVTSNGTSWVTLENTTQSTGEAWVQRSFLLGDYVPLTDQIRFRFVASDEGSGSLVEAGVDDFRIMGMADIFTGVDDTNGPAHITGLGHCQPNPFRQETRITYQMARPDRVTLQVFNVSGRLVATLVDGPVEAGEHHVWWNGRTSAGREIASGVYFTRLTTNGLTQVRRVILLR